MRQEIGLDEGGAPLVRAFLDPDEGRMVFRYLTVRTGGMAVWLPVGEDIQRAAAEERGSPQAAIAKAKLILARTFAGEAAARQEHVETLEAQVEALSDQLEEAQVALAGLAAPTEAKRTPSPRPASKTKAKATA